MFSTKIKHSLPLFALLALTTAIGQGILQGCSTTPSAEVASAPANTANATTTAAPAQTAAVGNLSPEENNKIAVRLFETAWNKGDLNVINELIEPEAMDHSPLASEKGSEGFKKIITSFRAAMPDLKMTVEDEVFSGDRVVHRWKVEGKHTAEPLFGVAASGKTITLTGITIVRLQNGKIAERWTQLDQLGLMTQLGLVPAPGEKPQQ